MCGCLFLQKHRSGIICDVWEKIDYNYEYEGSKYDKVVTTQYFLEKVTINFANLPNLMNLTFDCVFLSNN